MVRPPAPLALAIVLRTVGLGIDQHARIKQPKRIQGRLGCPEGSGKQWWALAIVPRPMVAPDRMMVSDCATVPDHGIEGGRLDSVPLRDQLAMPPSGMEGKIWRRPVRIDMGATAGYLAGTPSRLQNRALRRGFDLVVE